MYRFGNLRFKKIFLHKMSILKRDRENFTKRERQFLLAHNSLPWKQPQQTFRTNSNCLNRLCGSLKHSLIHQILWQQNTPHNKPYHFVFVLNGYLCQEKFKGWITLLFTLFLFIKKKILNSLKRKKTNFSPNLIKKL